jgi:hypothetical protein
MGIIPAIIAVAVIKIARKRLLPPSTAAAATLAPPRRADSANVTSKIAFATEIPMAMIAPMKDCTFSVVPVISSMSNTPQMTAGTADTTASVNRKD